MKFSIIGPGGIAQKMAEAVDKLEGVEAYAVASRNRERAQAFADQWGYEKVYGSYEEMLEDPQVELVYVATPHSHHYEHAKLCLEHGKHVLVEKAFTVNATQAEELIRIAEEKNLLLAEAIWTRYMPCRKMIDDIIESGVLGKVTSLTANLGYPLAEVERMQRPELAGGALLDLGVYPINFALMAFHGEVERIESTAVLTPEGVDCMNSMTLCFADGKMAVLHSNMLAAMDRSGMIYGDEGYLKIYNINNCEKIVLYDKAWQPVRTYPVPEQINGYEYEVLACIKAIQEGKTECREMPHAETMRVMKIMDQMRGQWGVRYPFE